MPGALRKLGITANGGQNQLKGRILRIAHCGYFGAFDILTSLAGLEMVLQQLGHEVELGAGVGRGPARVPRGGRARRRLAVPPACSTSPTASSSRRRSPTRASSLLREQFDVDLGLDWSDEELAERIGDYHGILIRSATQLTADLIDRGRRTSR